MRAGRPRSQGGSDTLEVWACAKNEIAVSGQAARASGPVTGEAGRFIMARLSPAPDVSP